MIQNSLFKKKTHSQRLAGCRSNVNKLKINAKIEYIRVIESNNLEVNICHNANLVY